MTAFVLAPSLSHTTLSTCRQGVYYQINQQTQECLKGKLNGPFLPHGVGASSHVFNDPSIHQRNAVPNSTFDGSFTIGSSSQPGSGLLTNAWNTNITSPQGTIQWFATFTEFGCNPIRDQYVFSDGHFVVEEFYDIVAGISSLSSIVSCNSALICCRRPQRVRAPVAVPPVKGHCHPPWFL